jgi:hypothetical protein
MGRGLYRVPFDFDWPLKEVWKGYITPKELIPPTCQTCGGDGYSVEARAIASTFYVSQISASWNRDELDRAEKLAWHDKIGQAEVDNLIEEGRLQTFWRNPEDPRDWEWQSLPRTAAEVNAEQHQRGFSGHDAINRGILVRFRCERLGIPLNCPPCQGHGNIATPEEREAYENWELIEPPGGPGYQLWETTSEGSPISPVFGTLEALCDYAAVNCSTFGSDRATAEQWRSMLDEDFVRAEYQAADGSRIVMM